MVFYFNKLFVTTFEYLEKNSNIELHLKPNIDNEYIPALTLAFRTYYESIDESIHRFIDERMCNINEMKLSLKYS